MLGGTPSRARHVQVAILTDPGGPVLVAAVSAYRRARGVAILTDPGGPVLAAR